jgi:hypothetical protein
MLRSRQILIRVSDAEYQTLATKAGVAGVSIPSLIREQIGRVRAMDNGKYLRLEQLLLTRIGTHLEIVAERCRNHDEKIAVMDIMARLIAIERELQVWKERRQS